MKYKDFIYLALIVLVGALLRLDLLAANHFVIDADEAIVGLMAKHILEGQPVPVFYYGQHYMGSLEAVCAAIVFRFFGISSLTLKIVPFAFSLLFIVAIYDLTLHAVNRRTAWITAILCAVPPSALMIWSSMARGGFIELILIGSLSFCALVRWLRQDQAGYGLIFIQGFLLGVGWWVNNQIIYFMLPTAVAITGRILYDRQGYFGFLNTLSRLFKTGLTGLSAWLAGSLPYWIYNIQNNWVSLEMFQAAGGGKSLKYLDGLYQKALPIILGGSRFWQTQDIYPGSIRIIAVVFCAVLFLLFCFRFRYILRALILKFNADSMPEVLLMFIFCCMAVFVCSSFGWLSQAPRYLLPMYVGIFPLTALVLDRILKSSRLIGGFCFILMLSINIASSYYAGRAVPGEPVVFKAGRVSKDHSELISWLRNNNVKWVRTNYWIGYRLAFETLEDTKFLLVHEPFHTRIKEWQTEAKARNIDAMPIIAVSTQARLIRKTLEIMHIEYQEDLLSGYHIFHDLKPIRVPFRKIDPDEFVVTANYKEENIHFAVDGDLNTRWGSGQAQKPDMKIRVDFKRPVMLAGIMYRLGNFETDYPRALKIEFVEDDGIKDLYFGEDGWEAIRHFMEINSEISFYFEPELVKAVIFKQTGRDSFFDWSVAEFEFYEKAE